MPARGIRWRRTRCLGGRRRRGLLRPASSRMRRRLVRPMSMPSRSLSSFAQMGVVGSLVSSAGQAHHVGGHRLGRGVDRFAAPVAVCQGGCSFLPVGVVMRRAWRVLTPINSAA